MVASESQRNPTVSRPYRSKAVKPCDACRRRRIACIRDDAAGNCSLCRHRGQTCTFMSVPLVRRNRRSIRPGRASGPSDSLQNVESLIANGPPRVEVNLTGQESVDKSATYVDHDWFNGTTTFRDKTCLFSGPSSDQDPHLLRHLTYDESECFGDDLWTVWRVGKHHGLPSYLTVYPNPHLNCHADMYSLEWVESLFAPHQNELIQLYYIHVHPSYPILEPQTTFQAARAEGRILASLLAVVYLHAAEFWHLSLLAQSHELPPQQELRQWIFSCLSLEARTPNLAVVQATLLYMQLTPRMIRAPNHPGFWPLTNMLVGVAQEIGLHVDPANWGIVPSERKLRRILWWAVYTHDKWIAHWLGRPSHITSNNWNVAPLTLSDFTDENECLSIGAVLSGNSFISLCTLSTILADVSDAFYSIRAGFDETTFEKAHEKARPLMADLRRWSEENSVSTSGGHSHQYLVRLAALSVRLSILRAVFGTPSAERNVRSESLAAEIVSCVRNDLFLIFDSLMGSQPAGIWLSYLKGNLAMIGSLLITLVLSSVTEADLEERRSLLLEFRSYLKRFTELHARDGWFEFARLPFRRLNLIIEEELFGEDQMDVHLITTPARTIQS